MIEVLVGLAIVAIGVFAVFRTYNYYLNFVLDHRHDVQAALLAEEGIEAVKTLRDASWSGKIAPLSSGTRYGLAWSGSAWTSTTSTKYVDSFFYRTFTLADVYRDSSYRIAASGTLDPNTKQVTVSVAYRTALATSTKSIGSYITNIFAN